MDHFFCFMAGLALGILFLTWYYIRQEEFRDKRLEKFMDATLATFQQSTSHYINMVFEHEDWQQLIRDARRTRSNLGNLCMILSRLTDGIVSEDPDKQIPGSFDDEEPPGGD